MFKFIAFTSAGIEPLLADELTALGADKVRPSVQLVEFWSDYITAQKICLWSRLSTRVLKHIADLEAKNQDMLYQQVRDLDWQPIFSKAKTFATEFIGTDKSIRNTQYGALLIKDAIADNLREEEGRRPDVDKVAPDVRIHARLHRGKCQVFVDYSGPSLHRRGLREQQGQAPIKEHLAAAMIIRSGWDRETNFVDLFCGSGTILLEAAAMHLNIAPGLNRASFGFERQPEFNQAKFNDLIEQARSEQKPATAKFFGFDNNKFVLDKARHNVDSAGFSDVIQLAQQDAANVQLNQSVKPGWIVSNPPYGERIGDAISLIGLFKRLGINLKQHFEGWHVGLLSGQAMLLKLLRLQKSKLTKLKNGPLDTEFVTYHLTEQQCQGVADDGQKYYLSKDGQAFENRVEKNLKRLTKWAAKEGINCYRIYDADIPEYNIAVDYYDGHIMVSEYQAPKSIDQNVAEIRLLDALSILQQKFDLSGDRFALKVRKSQKGKQQYEKEDDMQRRFKVQEYGAQFYVNIHDYLDSGLFLDHRQVRQVFAKQCQNKSVLNLFCYTGSLSVHAALNGAKQVTSVDMSNTYLDWAKDNFRLNKLNIKQHQFIREDCLAWLARCRDKFDRVFLDPPSFSNSKRMERTWDVQRDHVEIIELVKDRLNTDGEILFSNNLRNFKLDHDAIQSLGFAIKDITQQTLPEDFKRNTKIHHCWLLTLHG